MSVFAAEIGKPLAQPEEGWKRISPSELNNQYITKTGLWTHPQTGHSYDTSAGYTFKFKGNSIRILHIPYDFWTSQAQHVRIDGVDYHSVKFPESRTPVLAIDISGLDDGIHTVEVLATYAGPGRHFDVIEIDIPDEAIMIEKSAPVKLSVLLSPEEQVQLSTSYNLDNNSNFTWSSSNEAAATVDNKGKVTAVAAGDADIYAENADGTFREFIPVKVFEGMIDEMRLSVHLNVGEKAKLFLADETSAVTWSSMEEGVARISEDGQVTGVSKGLAIIKGALNGETYQIYVRING